jgi:hypothetical protein
VSVRGEPSTAPFEQSVASLAARTFASEDDVRGALQYVEGRGLLRIDRQSEDEFVLVPLGRGGPPADSRNSAGPA